MAARDRSVAKSWSLYEHACRRIPLGTQTNSKAPSRELQGIEPCFVRRGDGASIWDVDGNEYLDFRCSLGPITLGHNFPAVTRAVMEQLSNGTTFSYPCPLELEVAELLCATVPCAEMVRFLKTGGEAMAAAFKVARAFTGRDVILRCGYHGWLSATDQPGVPQEVNRLFPSFGYGDVDGLRKLAEQHSERLAAISIAASYSHLSPTDLFLSEARKVADNLGALLIFDEIVTGFRVALGGVQEYFRVKPDLAVFSKGMANGYPISALLGRAEIMRALEKTTVSSTFGGEALSLAAAKATIGVYQNEPVIEHIWTLGERMVRGVNEICAKAGMPIRYVGLPCCPQLIFDSGDPKSAHDLQIKLMSGLIKRGIIIYTVTYVNYSHSLEDISLLLAAWRETVSEEMRF
ncbi:MAG TPA: aminotransferase class III-fold pyridoxal phosphate-dependent enzyme [Candidatus Brocadiia bacterium]|nr:aminotransferase class III-fold pyridoxal phosphate-dependent enzyme [Candidatus Brocadiia bacterium]